MKATRVPTTGEILGHLAVDVEYARLWVCDAQYRSCYALADGYGLEPREKALWGMQTLYAKGSDKSFRYTVSRLDLYIENYRGPNGEYLEWFAYVLCLMKKG